MTPAELQHYLHTHIPLSKAMDVSVLEADIDTVVLGAPLAPNINHRDTVFGGSSSALATLAAWGLLYLRLLDAKLPGRLVIQSSTMQFTRPIDGFFTAVATIPDAAVWEQFLRTFRRRGKARIAIVSRLLYRDELAGLFEGQFAAHETGSRGSVSLQLQSHVCRGGAGSEEQDMPSVFDKLNLKEQREILVIDAPDSFEPELKALKDTKVIRDAAKIKVVQFALVFATTQKQVDAAAKVLTDRAEGDAILWFAYPKGTSKKYRCDFNRDSGWTVLGKAGYEPVRMVAIDVDWSALRFRRAEYIKSMTRDASRTHSALGKKRTTRR